MTPRKCSVDAKISRSDSVRLPTDLREWLLEQAANNHRSFSGEVVHRLVMSRKAECESLMQKGQQP